MNSCYLKYRILLALANCSGVRWIKNCAVLRKITVSHNPIVIVFAVYSTPIMFYSLLSVSKTFCRSVD